MLETAAACAAAKTGNIKYHSHVATKEISFDLMTFCGGFHVIFIKFRHKRVRPLSLTSGLLTLRLFVNLLMTDSDVMLP